MEFPTQEEYVRAASVTGSRPVMPEREEKPQDEDGETVERAEASDRSATTEWTRAAGFTK